MTERDAPTEPSRRRVLAATGVGLAGALAGCGYRPGGGDLAWESSLGGGGLFGPGDRWFRPVGDRLFVVRNRSGRTYDFEDDAWRDYENAGVTALDPTGETRLEAETERQAAAPPAVTEAAIVVPVAGDRVTAIDRETAAFDLDDPGVDDGGSGTDEPDPIRWQVDIGAATADESSGSDGSTESDDGATDDGPSASVDAVRASDRVVAAVIPDDTVVLDAETGDRAFDLAAAWPGVTELGPGAVAPDRVAVDGEDVWVVVTGLDAASGSDTDAVLARFDPTGERRVTRPLSSGADWLVVVDDTVVVGNTSGDSVRGFDRSLDRRFALDVPTPRKRPPLVEGGGSDDAAGACVYLRRGETARALDVATGEIAWERDGLPASRPFAADVRGIYAVGREAVREGSRETRPVIVAVGAGGGDRWSAPLPDGVRVEALFAVGDRLLVVDGEELYGFRAAPGERWSLL